MDRFVEYASTYWYIAASLALILFLGVVVLIFLIYNMQTSRFLAFSALFLTCSNSPSHFFAITR